MFSVLGFAFACVSNIHIFVILCDFWLLSAYFCYIIVNIRILERQSDRDGKKGINLGTDWRGAADAASQ
jgi:hypothetical protein